MEQHERCSNDNFFFLSLKTCFCIFILFVTELCSPEEAYLDSFGSGEFTCFIPKRQVVR